MSHKMTISERLVMVETELKNIKSDISEIKGLISEQIKIESKRAETFERKFAAKWVERVLIIVIAGVAVAIAGIVIKL